MSKYTTSFYDLDMEVNKDKFLSMSIDERLDNLIPLIFDFDYPIDDATTRARINKAILKHYYMREIAFETWGLFKIKLNDRLNLIGRRYNELYKNYDEKINPFINSYVKELSTSKGNSESTNNSTNNYSHTTDNFNSQSDTPQGILKDLKAGKYSSFATIDSNKEESETTDTSSNTSNSNNEGSREVQGLQGLTQAEAFRNYFDNVISLDEEIVNEISDLFLIIW